MATEIPRLFLRRLIEIGASQEFSGLQTLFAEFPVRTVGHLMRQSPEFWFSIADTLPDAELEALIRAITVAERDFPEFGGGSVSGVIWTFRRLTERNGGDRDSLADWILAHTTNGWAPYGKDNGGARSLAELTEYRRRAAEGRTARHKAEEDRHEDAVVRKSEKATRDIYAAIRRKDTMAVQALLLRGARLDTPNASGLTVLAYAETLGDAPILDILRRVANPKG